MGVEGTDREQVIGAIVRLLAPYIGENMARASTRGHCDKLGFKGARLRSEQIELLVSTLSSGLSVFVGREKTALIVVSMHKEIGKLGTGK